MFVIFQAYQYAIIVYHHSIPITTRATSEVPNGPRSHFTVELRMSVWRDPTVEAPVASPWPQSSYVLFRQRQSRSEWNENERNQTTGNSSKKQILSSFFRSKNLELGWHEPCWHVIPKEVAELPSCPQWRKLPYHHQRGAHGPYSTNPLFAFQRIFTNPHVSHEAWFIWFVLNWHLNYITLYWFIWQFMTIHNDMNSSFVDIFPIWEAFPPGLTEYAIQKVQTPCAHNFNGSNPTSQPTQDFSGVNFINQRIFIREKQTRTRVSHSLHSLGQFKGLSWVWPIMLLNDCITPSISHQQSEACAIGEHQRIKIGSWQKSWHQKRVWFQI